MQLLSYFFARQEARQPTKYAIANGLYMGQFPSDMGVTTFTENAMLNLSQPMHFISVVRGGKHALSISRVFFRADPAPPAQRLPRDVVAETVVAVTMVGATTPAQMPATLKIYDVCVLRLRKHLDWYRMNNQMFSNINEPPDWETTVSTMRTRIAVDRCEDEQQVRSACDASETEKPPEVNHASTPEPGSQPTSKVNSSSYPEIGECTSNRAGATGVSTNELHGDTADISRDGGLAYYGESPVLNSLTGLHGDIMYMFQYIMTSQHKMNYASTPLREKKKKQVVVYRSSVILSDFHPAFWTNSFCERCPYGRGGPDYTVFDCPRANTHIIVPLPWLRLTFLQEIVHYKLSSLKQIYCLKPWGMLQVCHEMNWKTYVRYQQDRRQALSRKKQLRQSPEMDRSIRDLCANISTGMRSFGGQTKSVLRHVQTNEIWPATIFFTISPDSASTFRIANIAGNITSRVLAEMDNDLQKSTETQSSTGSLHSHMLTWVEGMLSTVNKYYAMCASEKFRNALVKHVDPIATSSIPLHLSSSPSCASNSIGALGFERGAFRKPRREL
ncbi:hypothetical protein GQ600_5064 [Phytophthora cactorum]|nr:hypothetical protein GQ600_5064 [Phytophthora cactorum]